MSKSTEQCRKYFADAGLTYNDITSGDICVLVMLLNKHIKRACKEKTISCDDMRMSEKIKSKYRTNGKLINCYLRVNSSYFTRRECISFNTDGFIGFAGWSDSTNVQPILAAFVEWVDCLKEQKEALSAG